MKKVQYLFCLLALLPVLSANAQYTGSVYGIVDDMTSVSSYRSGENTSDSTACNYRTWTPSRNGYRITQAGAEYPHDVSGIHINTALAASCPMTSGAGLSAVGAASPYETSETTPAAMSRPRRVSPGGGIGEPGAIPVGDIPWLLVLLTAAACAIYRSKHLPKTEVR
mgnify:CR=1 FL=1